MTTQNGKVIILLIEMLLLELSCTAMIRLDTGFMSGAFVGGGGRGAGLCVMSEATALCGGGGWMASEYKV